MSLLREFCDDVRHGDSANDGTTYWARASALLALAAVAVFLVGAWLAWVGVPT